MNPEQIYHIIETGSEKVVKNQQDEMCYIITSESIKRAAGAIVATLNSGKKQVNNPSASFPHKRFKYN